MFLNTTFLVQQWNLYVNFCLMMEKINISGLLNQYENNTMYVRGCFVTGDASNVNMIKELNLVHDTIEQGIVFL